MYAVGLMSGTSLDGVDASLVKITGLFKKEFKQIGFIYYPYEDKFKNKLLNVCLNKPITIQQVCSLNVELSEYYIKAIDKLLLTYNLKKKDLSFIAMHGQTVWHNPNHLGGFESSTLQLGDASRVSAAFDTKVVSNFRTMDMSFGGQGAPLVPFANWYIYHNNKENIALQNIGGISNVTYLSKGGAAKDVIAFDNGPGNILIDQAMKILFNLDFDNHGEIASRGKVIHQALDILFKDPYLRKPLPKSTGREAYNEDFVREVIKMVYECGGKDEDVIATLSAYTADTISDSYKYYLGEHVNKVIVSGGGAYNDFIIKRLQHNLDCKVEKANDADSLEALSFAILGYHTLKHQASNIPLVTGASRPCVLGEVTNPKERRISL